MNKCKRCEKEINRGNWCNSCRVTKARRERKKLLVEYKGGCCDICGYNKFYGALDFHHKNSEEKDFGLSKSGICRTFEDQKKEVDKCILVCANCHREIHGENVVQ